MQPESLKWLTFWTARICPVIKLWTQDRWVVSPFGWTRVHSFSPRHDPAGMIEDWGAGAPRPLQTVITPFQHHTKTHPFYSAAVTVTVRFHTTIPVFGVKLHLRILNRTTQQRSKDFFFSFFLWSIDGSCFHMCCLPRSPANHVSARFCLTTQEW